MPIWKPPGQVTESPAKWEANPDRCTFILQALIDLMNDGKFRNTPTTSAFNDVSKLFWVRYNVYHTPKQLKNFYQNRKAFWGVICWARDRTGIGWDDSQKKIIASDDWWRSHEGRKGLMALKDKSIQDYDLLSILFEGQIANTNYCYGPNVPIPLVSSSDEGSGDSENPDDIRFSDTQVPNSQGDASMNCSSGSKRRRDKQVAPPAKKPTFKKNDDTLSPQSAKYSRKVNKYLDIKESRRRALESTVTIPPSGMGSQIPSGSTINSKALITYCMEVMTNELKIEEDSDLYFYALQIFAETPDFQSAFLTFSSPSMQLKWLKKSVALRFPEKFGAQSQTGYDLNHPPHNDDS